MAYTLGIDVGVGSLGMALIERTVSDDGNVEHVGIIDGHSRVFPAATGSAKRRLYRSSRGRYGYRRERLEKLKLLLASVLSINPDSLDTGRAENVPTEMSATLLRAKGITAELEPLDLTRAIYHIAKSRGVRLARATTVEGKDGKEKKKNLKSTRDANRRMLDTIAGDEDLQTVGQYLAWRIANGQRVKSARNADNGVDFAISRNDTEPELESLLKKQSEFYPALSPEETRQDIFNQVFIERVSPRPKPGECCYSTGQERLAIGSSLFQEKRLLEEINNIRIRTAQGRLRNETGLLSLEERNILLDYVRGRKESTAKDIKKKLKIDEHALLSLEGTRRGKSKKIGAERKLKGHAVELALKGSLLEPVWMELSEDHQKTLLKALRVEDDFSIFSTIVKVILPNTTDSQLEELSDITLPQGYGRAGAEATGRLVEELRRDVITTHKAEIRAGLRHVKAPTGDRDHLPYYGTVLGHYCSGGTKHPKDTLEIQHGRIPNPVVHQALNQIRKAVNLYIKKYGKPDEIAIELSRDLSKSLEERNRITKDNKDREAANQVDDELIHGCGKKPSRKYRRALKLHRFQAGICPYTGDNMAEGDIFNGRAEIDHVLPHSRTYNDRLGNLVLCKTQANRYKAERSPYEAFNGGYHFNGRVILYPQILDRVKGYPEFKQKYFMEDAMERYREENAFLKRFEGDTRYLGKVAKEYLSRLADPKGAQVRVRVLTGGITSDLRYFWGVHNLFDDKDQDQDKPPETGKKPKNREDSRHHLIDAIVIACANRRAILKFQTQRKQYNSTSEFHKGINSGDTFPIPWRDFRKDVVAFSDNPRLVVQKQNHNPFGQLHKETSHRVLAHDEKNGRYVCSVRKALAKIYSGTKVSFASIRKTLEIKNKDTVMATIRDIQSGKVPGRFYWKADDPEKTMNELIAARERIIDRIEALFHQQPHTMTVLCPATKQHPAENAEQELKENERVRMAVEQYTADTKQRTFQAYERGSSLQIIGKPGPNGQPVNAYWSRNNSRMDIYIDGNMEYGWEVIQRIDEAKRDFTPRWQRENPDARLLHSLRRNDEVEIWHDIKNPPEERSRIMARVQNISDGDITFCPVEKGTSHNKSPHMIRIRTLKSFAELQLTRVVRDAIGEEKFRSRRRNR